MALKRQRKSESVFSSKRKTDNIKRTDTSTRRVPRQQTSRKQKKKKSAGKILFPLFVTFFVVIIILFGISFGMYAAISREIKDMDIKNLSLNYSSAVYYTDERGNSHELEQLFNEGNRIWLNPDQIPKVMKDAVVAIEDERFYKHNGVDLKRTTGAFINWMVEKMGGQKASYGGSTLTQQVVKNITHEKERSSMRKIKEMMRAIAIERELSKDEIITLYLNIVFFANNSYGVEAAANIYFDKTALELDLHEAATIAGITQRPSYYDPIKNPENALTKRNTVLSKMYEHSMITEEEYEKSKSKDLDLKGDHKEKQSKVYSYFVDQVINDVIYDLQVEKGYTEAFATQQVYNGGLKIYTTMDVDVQNAMEEVYENPSNFPGTSAAQKAESAMVIMDHQTGQIKGIVGGRGVKKDSRGLNRATQSKRQPGSSFKPISVYAPSIELGKITAATPVKDEKITIGDWSPKNAYSGYEGAISLRRAIEISSNTVAVKTLQDLGVETSYNYLKDKFHISTLDSADKSLSPLGLGGLTHGVTVEEMTAAYAAFANDGQYIKPHTYTKVVDNKGKVLLENKSEKQYAVSKATAYIMTDLLTSVVKGSSGTGKLARLGDMPVAGKTGTTNDDKDKWFVGYTPYYVGTVWYGFDTPKSIRKAGVGTNVSAQIWKKVMEKVHADLEVKEFEIPDEVERVKACNRSGKLASSGCSAAAYEYFPKNAIPTKYCGYKHMYSSSSSDSKNTASPSPKPDDDKDDDNENNNDENNNSDEDKSSGSSSKETHKPTASAPAKTHTPTSKPADDDVVVID